MITPEQHERRMRDGRMVKIEGRDFGVKRKVVAACEKHPNAVIHIHA